MTDSESSYSSDFDEDRTDDGSSSDGSMQYSSDEHDSRSVAHLMGSDGLPLYSRTTEVVTNMRKTVDMMSQQLENVSLRQRKMYVSKQQKREMLIRTGAEPLVMHKGVGFAMAISWFWATLLWIGVIYGLASDGWWVYVRYFTNWMWTFGAVFYTLYILAFLDKSGHAHNRLIHTAFWPYLGNVVAVLLLARLMLLEDSSMLTEAAEQYSWNVVQLVEWGKHSLPAVVIFVLIICISANILSSMRQLQYKTRADRESFWLYVVVQFICTNALPLGYSMNNDFHRVYHMRINTVVAILILETIYMAAVVVPIILTSPITDMISKNPPLSQADLRRITRTFKKQEKQQKYVNI